MFLQWPSFSTRAVSLISLGTVFILSTKWQQNNMKSIYFWLLLHFQRISTWLLFSTLCTYDRQDKQFCFKKHHFTATSNQYRIYVMQKKSLCPWTTTSTTYATTSVPICFSVPSVPFRVTHTSKRADTWSIKLMWELVLLKTGGAPVHWLIKCQELTQMLWLICVTLSHHSKQTLMTILMAADKQLLICDQIYCEWVMLSASKCC